VIAGATRILHEYLQVKDGQFKTIEDIDTAFYSLWFDPTRV
jgi:hypothetical protein